MDTLKKVLESLIYSVQRKIGIFTEILHRERIGQQK